MKKYTVTAKQQTGTNTTIVQMKPKDGSSGIQYAAGQYLAVGFRKGWQRTPMRCFSATTAPSDSGELGIAFRNGGAFTTAFSQLTPGSRVEIAGPFGDFTVSRDETRPLMFLAGGIGITPFLSILRDLQYRRNVQPVTLLYSVSSLQDVPFARELMDLARQNPNYTISFLARDVPVDKVAHPMIDQTKLSEDIIQKYMTADTQYYICGPSGYATTAHSILDEMGVDESYIHNEAFSQSSKVEIAGFAVQKLVYGMLTVAIFLGAGLFSAKDFVKSHLANSYLPSSNSSQTASSTAAPTSTASAATPSTNGSSSSSTSASSQYNYSPPQPQYQSPRSMMS